MDSFINTKKVTILEVKEIKNEASFSRTIPKPKQLLLTALVDSVNDLKALTAPKNPETSNYQMTFCLQE